MIKINLKVIYKNWPTPAFAHRRFELSVYTDTNCGHVIIVMVD